MLNNIILPYNAYTFMPSDLFLWFLQLVGNFNISGSAVVQQQKLLYFHWWTIYYSIYGWTTIYYYY